MTMLQADFYVDRLTHRWPIVSIRCADTMIVTTKEDMRRSIDM